MQTVTYRDANDNDRLTARLELDDAEREEILGGFYGRIAQTKELPGGRLLVEAHLAEGGEDGWEAGEWYVVDNLGVHHLCTCDGFNGVSAVHDKALYEELMEIDDELIEPYQISGLHAEASAAERVEAEEGDLCNIEVCPCFYDPDHRNAPYLLKDEDTGDVAEFSFAEAQEWIADQEEQPYHTAHNEAGRPSYRIVKA